MVRLVYFTDSALIIICLLNSVLGKQLCDSTTWVNRQCSAFEICVPTKDLKNGFCDCFPGYVRLDNDCKNITNSDGNSTPKSSSLIDKDQSNSNGHVVAGILIPLFIIMVVTSGFYINRKYHFVNYVRNKFKQRNSNYDEVMIGQDLDDDDPPLC